MDAIKLDDIKLWRWKHVWGKFDSDWSENDEVRMGVNGRDS